MKQFARVLRTTAHICSAPVGRFGLYHIFTSAIATVKTSYMRGTLDESNGQNFINIAIHGKNIILGVNYYKHGNLLFFVNR
jgi:hypothetical protein